MRHKDRNIYFKTESQKARERELGCKFIRINPDEQNFDIFKAIIEIHRRIGKSSKNR